jgi:hypothetical protein
MFISRFALKIKANTKIRLLLQQYPESEESEDDDPSFSVIVYPEPEPEVYEVKKRIKLKYTVKYNDDYFRNSQKKLMMMTVTHHICLFPHVMKK